MHRVSTGGKYTHSNPVCQGGKLFFYKKIPKKSTNDCLQLKKYIFAR